jgi:hypothetical protein
MVPSPDVFIWPHQNICPDCDKAHVIWFRAANADTCACTFKFPYASGGFGIHSLFAIRIGLKGY